MIKRLIGYLRWDLEELLGRKNTAKIYDDLIKRNEYESIIDYNRRVKIIRTALLQLSEKYHTVLDMACGTGAVIDAFPHNEKLSITGIDISQGMLATAQKRFKQYKNIKLSQQDFMTASFPSSSFDLIVIAHAIRFVPKGKELVFSKRLSSWLNNNGTFLVIETLPIYNPYLPSLLRKYWFKSNFQGEKNIAQLLNPLQYEKKMVVGRQALIFKTTAYYFKKK